MYNRRAPGPPEEEPAIPIDAITAKSRSEDLKLNIEKIKTLRAEGKTKEEIQKEVSRFADDYPALFKMLFSTDLQQGSLNTMIAMLEKMGTGELSQHQASVIVGQRLHDVFIKPKISEMERKED